MSDLVEQDVSRDTEDAVNLTPQKPVEQEQTSTPPLQEKKEIEEPVRQPAGDTKVSNVIGNDDIEELDLPF
jgi:hypothetical protein